MLVLCFDTETTGLPPKGAFPSKVGADYPYIVQLSFVVYDTETNSVVQEENHLVKVPVKVDGSQAAAIHKITDHALKTKGVEFAYVYYLFQAAAARADLVVGHNLEFDLNMMRAQCARHNFPFCVDKDVFCTMKSTIDLCAIRRQNSRGAYNKYPSLLELYRFLFKEDPTELHNAIVDVYACLRCFVKVKLGKDCPAEIVARISTARISTARQSASEPNAARAEYLGEAHDFAVKCVPVHVGHDHADI
jgi:DNA polymerase III epsilon subunit-like protein